MAHFDRDVIPERRMHAKGWGAHGTFTVTPDITGYPTAESFSEVGKKTPLFARLSTVAGERGPAAAVLDTRGSPPPLSTQARTVTITAPSPPVFFFPSPLP